MNDEPGSRNGGNQNIWGKDREEPTESKSVNQRRDKECNHEDETKTLYNRTREPDWDDIETQE